MQLPEYEGKTFGAISLLGDEQAAMIQSLVQRLVPLPELERRRFVAGNPAQFQGDERDIVFLSMVDVPDEQGQPLPIQERLTFKQRYNVAGSRAKDQLWLVHSLDPARDLQPGDLRRRLIEHVRDPAASRKAPTASRRAQSPFEEEVLERLRAGGFRVDPQVEVGGFPIDLVVSDGRQQVAIECDGDRTKTPVRIAADMARQAVLERVGWRFIRVRGTRFFRDRDGAMDAVFAELRRLGVQHRTPKKRAAPQPQNDFDMDMLPTMDGVVEEESTVTTVSDPDGENLRNKVVRRAWQLMRDQEWVGGDSTTRPSAPGVVQALSLKADTERDTEPNVLLSDFAPHPSAQIAELILDDTTEPNFVILEQWEDRQEN
jgi:very-short-patch-repair endonuclease